LPSELLIIVWQLNIVLLEDYRLIVERRWARPSGRESYAGGSVNSWQCHTCQTGQRVGAKQSLIPGLPGWRLGVWLTTTPLKNLLLRNIQGIKQDEGGP
jgi:hypothetical protein